MRADRQTDRKIAPQVLMPRGNSCIQLAEAVYVTLFVTVV